MDYKTILVPYDFSDHANAALAVADDLAKRFGADLHLLHVLQMIDFLPEWSEPVPLDAMLGERRRATEHALAEVASNHARGAPHVYTHLDEAQLAVERICESARELGANLIVMGTHGRTGFAHAFLGSVTERTLRSAPCPVLAVRASKEREKS